MPAELETPGSVFETDPSIIKLSLKTKLELAHVFEVWALQLKEHLAKSKRAPRFNHN